METGPWVSQKCASESYRNPESVSSSSFALEDRKQPPGLTPLRFKIMLCGRLTVKSIFTQRFQHHHFTPSQRWPSSSFKRNGRFGFQPLQPTLPISHTTTQPRAPNPRPNTVPLLEPRTAHPSLSSRRLTSQISELRSSRDQKRGVKES